MFQIDVEVRWGLAIAAQLCVYLVFRLRKHQLDLPAFNIYILSLLTVSCCRFGASFVIGRLAYFWVYWASEAVIAVTFMALTIGVLCKTLGPFGNRRPYLTIPFAVLFLAAVICSFFLAGIIRHMGLNANPRYVLTNCFTILQQTVAGVCLVFLGGAAIISAVLSIEWDRRDVAIVLGMFAEVGVDAVLLRIMDVPTTLASQHATVAARLIVVCIWLFYFSEERPEVKSITPAEREEIRELLRKMGEDSLTKRRTRHERFDDGGSSSTTSTGATWRFARRRSGSVSRAIGQDLYQRKAN